MAAIFSVFVLAYGFIKSNNVVINIALTGLVLAAVTAIPVFLTGEPAEESVEHLPGILESAIEEHEEAAEIAFWLMQITGIVSLAGVFLRKSGFMKGFVFNTVILLLPIAAAGSIAYTGYLGGKIRHTEINAGASAPMDNSGEPANAEGGEETEDED